MRALVTGGAGFIGHHVVDALLREGHSVISLDRLDCSGNQNRLSELIPDLRDFFEVRETIPSPSHPEFRVMFHDLRAEINPLLVRQIGPVDWVLHLAASTHVDRSIADPMLFVMDNVVGTTNALMFARDQEAKFLYFSTDEVFGPAPSGTAYREWDRYRSGNPYAASKAGGEEMALAFANTYGLDVRVTHTMNVIGRRQHPEKFVPSTIRKVRDGDEVLIHADPLCTYPGSRFYIDAAEVARSVLFVMKRGRAGDKYNIVGEREMDNLEMANRIAEAVGKPLKYKLINFHGSRPGHDLRYALDGEKLVGMGFERRLTIEQSIRETVRWTLDNPHWL